MAGVRSRFDPVVPKNNTLEHRGLVLDNGLTVVLVRNPDEKEVASVALSVARGHMSDPREMPGTAHFCEHMLFLGNEAYPVEGDYKKYLREHGGGANAFTSATTTCYYFHVVSDYLEGAVDRFLNFFVSPLFTEDATDRELNAIESEYHKNLLGDGKRVYYLLKHLSNPEHPFSKFGSGNKKTLLETPKETGIDNRKTLMNFYNDNYSADVMSLVMRSDHSFEEMEKWVLEGFAKITSSGMEKEIQWEGSHLTSNELGKIARYLPINKASRTMSVKFPYKTIRPAKERSALVSHLLGHEGRGSLCHYLREKSLVTGLTSSETIHDNFGHFSLGFTLTEEGHRRIETVLKEMFSYVATVRTEEAAMRELHEQRKSLGKLLFNSAPRVSSARCAMTYASALRHCEETTTFLSSRYWTDDFNQVDLNEKLSAINPRNMLVLASDPDPSQHGAEIRSEPWWGVQYTLTAFTEEQLVGMESAPPTPERYAMPPQLEFIPNRTNIWDEASSPDEPSDIALGSDLIAMTWLHKAFNNPMVALHVGMMSPFIGATPFAQAAALFVYKILKIELAVDYYDLEQTHNWDLSFSSRSQQFFLSIIGYDDKADGVTKTLLKSVLTLPLTERTFNMVKEKRIREIKAAKTSRNPLELANQALSQVLNTKPAPMEETDKEVYEMTWEKAKQFWEAVKGSVNVQVTAVGNIEKNMSEEVAKIVSETITGVGYGGMTAPHLSGPAVRPRRVCLPVHEAPSEYRIMTHTPNPTNLDSAALIHYQLGPRTYRTLAHVSVLNKIMSPRFFTSLRTQQQLGYMVSVVNSYSCKVVGMDFRVQSGVQPPSVIHQRIEEFLTKTREELLEFSTVELEEVVRASIEVHSVPYTNLTQLSEAVQACVVNGLPWEDDKKIVSELQKVTKESIIDFYHTHLRPPTWATPCSRRVVAVYSYSDPHAESEMKPFQEATKTRSLGDADTVAITDLDHLQPQAWQAATMLYPNTV